MTAAGKDDLDVPGRVPGPSRSGTGATEKQYVHPSELVIAITGEIVTTTDEHPVQRNVVTHTVLEADQTAHETQCTGAASPRFLHLYSRLL